MGFFNFCFIFFLFISMISSINACDRCLHQSKVSFFPKAYSFTSGACGYGSLTTAFYGVHIAAASPRIYISGLGCGACFQVRCKDPTMCSENGTRVTVTDQNQSNQTDFVFTRRAFIGMAKRGMHKNMLKRGVVDMEYKRIPCDYKGQNLVVRVEDSTRRPDYLALKILRQGGQTEIMGIDIAEQGSSKWSSMSRNHGAVWDIRRFLVGALQLRLFVISGFDGKWIWADTVLPANWVIGGVYTTSIQIEDIALEGCIQCGEQNWN